MTGLLLRIFIRDSENVKDPKVRMRYGILSGFIGIFCNLLLFTAKIIIGTISGSIAITADAFNNLSDSGSNAVSIFGFKMASRPADKEHPFGHGRYEYLSALIVALIVLVVGVELLGDSLPKIMHPEKIEFSIPLLVVLLFSMLIKLWMGIFYKKTGKKIDSAVMLAASADSRNDVLTTGGVLASVLIGHFTGLPLDGWVGLAVSVFILISGVNIVKETLGPILGQPPTNELVGALTEKVLSYEGVLGIHDLVVHNYGVGKWMATLHAEVPANHDFIESHDLIDTIERDVREELGLELVIHMDPIVTDNNKINLMRDMLEELIKEIHPALTIHDFRMVEGPSHTNLVFDVTVPFEFKIGNDELIDAISAKTDELDGNYFAVAMIDRSYVPNLHIK